MSFVKNYIVEIDVPKRFHFYALVTGGNSRSALQKFLFHITEISGWDASINTEFVSHKPDDDNVIIREGTKPVPNKNYKMYYNKDHSAFIGIRQINPHDDFTYVGGVIIE